MLKFLKIKREDTHRGEHHQHPVGQLFYVHQGTFVFETPGGRWVMPSFKAGWVPPHIKHNCESFGPMLISGIYVCEQACVDLPKDVCVFTPSTLLTSLIETIAELDLTQRSRRCDNITNLFIDEMQMIRAEPLHVPFPKDWKISQVLQQVIQQPGLKISLDALAQQANLSRRSFCRHFKQQLGVSFGQWHCQLKVVKACEYLAQGMSVTETAFNLGFSQVSSFIALFKKYLRTTPSEYKK